MTVLGDHVETLRRALERLHEIEAPLEAAASSIARSLGAGGKLLVAGNGGSAAEAQHLTAELLGRLDSARERQASAGSSLTCRYLDLDCGRERLRVRQHFFPSGGSLGMSQRRSCSAFDERRLDESGTSRRRRPAIAA